MVKENPELKGKIHRLATPTDDRLNTILPHFYLRDVASKIKTHEMWVDPEILKHYEQALDLLVHPSLRDATLNGQFTVALIKPNAYEGRNLSKDDDEAAEQLIAEATEMFVTDVDFDGKRKVNKNRKKIFAIPIHLTPQEAELFYASNKEEFVERGIWEDHIRRMSSAPSTAMLFYDAEGKAAERWRECIGKTNPDPTENSLRAKFALSIKNNLFHGSENRKEAVREELALLTALGAQYLKLKPYPEEGAPHPDELLEQGIITNDEIIIWAAGDKVLSKKTRKKRDIGHEVRIIDLQQDKVRSEFVFNRDDIAA